eukprot:TRINITY_DN12759_c0_g1_i1.p1 TRINITY_DN12759_c0_g1~~TRINITY_DN12759_c0_g1_i1.p1  ORF type:complete len:336 (+),score=61.10 TRINITY_DN12759_c0_g1_i1:28-1035(+)
MKPIFTFVLVTILLASASATPDDNTRFKEFLYGLGKGLGIQIDYSYLVKENFSASDVNAANLFSYLRRLGQMDLGKISSGTQAIEGIYQSFVFLKSQRPNGLSGNYNLYRTVNLTETALRNASLFLNQVVSRGLQGDLKNISLGVPDQMVFVGFKLGSLILEDGVSFISFLKGLAEGLNQTINPLVFIVNNFNYDQDTVQDIFNVLALLNDTSYSLEIRIEMAITQLEFKFMMVGQNQSAVLRKDDGLTKIFYTILPSILNVPSKCLKTIESHNLKNLFPPIGESVRYDLRQTGARLGAVLKLIYSKQNPQVSLMEVPFQSRKSSFLRKLLNRKQ